MEPDYWDDEDYENNEYKVTEDTPVKEVIRILEIACNALNHEDEDYIPAIRFAIRRLEKCV